MINQPDDKGAAIAAYDDALWQPIESAPKDGTRIIGADFELVETMFWTASIWVGGGGWVNDLSRSDTRIFQPTHWRPLPSPPKDAGHE